MASKHEHIGGVSELEERESLRSLYDIDAIDEWRELQFIELKRMADSKNDGKGGPIESYVDEFLGDRIVRLLTEYLVLKGAVDEVEHDYHLRQLYMQANVIRIDEDSWVDPPAVGAEGDDELHPSRNSIEEEINQWKEEHPLITRADYEGSMSQAKLDQYRLDFKTERQEVSDKYAAIVAERSKRLVELPKTAKDIDELKEEATALVATVAIMMIEEMKAAGSTEAEWELAAGEFVDECAEDIISKMEGNRIGEYRKTNFLKRWYMDKWAIADEQSRDKETGKTKIFSKGTFKKALLTAPAALAAGAGAGVLVPLAAGGLAISGVGAGLIGLSVLSFRAIGRNIAGGYLDRQAGEKELKSKQSHAMREDYESSMAQAADQGQRETIFEVMDRYSDFYRKKNMRRAIGGVAMAGVAGAVGGSIAGGAASWAADKVNFAGALEWIQDKWSDIDISNPFDAKPSDTITPSAAESATPASTESTSSTSRPGEASPPEHTKGPQGKTTDPKVDPLPKVPPVEHVEAPPAPVEPQPSMVDMLLNELSVEAQTISRGEGLFKTFADHGIPKEHWGALIKDVGPKLDEAYPSLVYFHEPSCEWRLDFNDGVMPEGASEIIYEAAQEGKWLGEVLQEVATVDAVVEVTTEDVLAVASEPFDVEPASGLIQQLAKTVEASGLDAKPGQAAQVHEYIVEKEGPDYIDYIGKKTPIDALPSKSMPDVYSMGPRLGQVGISNYGLSEWSNPELVAEAIERVFSDSISGRPLGAGGVTVDELRIPTFDKPGLPGTGAVGASEVLAGADLTELNSSAQSTAAESLWRDMSSDIDRVVEHMRAGELSVLNSDLNLHGTLNTISSDIKEMAYANSDVPMMRYDEVTDRWLMNPIPEGAEVPEIAIETIREHQKSLYALTA